MSGSYIDRFKEVEAERDGLTERINLLRADLDAVTVERDEAYKQRDEARSQSKTIGDAWAKFEREHDAALAEARRERDEARAKSLGLLESQINDARAILGARPDELLSDAAKRVVRAVESVYPGPQVLREILGAAEGQGVIPAARAVVADLSAARARIDCVHSILEGPPGMLVETRADAIMASMRMYRERTEAEPPRVFRVKAEVKVTTVGGAAQAEVRICQNITDPTFLDLALRKVARLGLVVCDG